MSNVFMYRMPAGIPGALNRLEHCAVVPEIMDPDDPATLFGVPIKIDETSKKVQPIQAGDAAADVKGFLVRPYPTQYTSNEALGAATPNSAMIADVMKRGYMTVKNNAGTPAKEGQAYVRIADPGAGADEDTPIGGIEAALVQDETVAITDCFFTGPADANGNVEISYKI